MAETHHKKDPADAVPEQEKTFIGAAGLFFLELIKVAILAGITIGMVRYFLFKPFYVKGQSMEPTFFEHEYLIIDEITYRFREPERGEIVVFRAPNSPKDYYLKRVIGLPGERVKVEGNKIIIYNDANPLGVVMEEAYIDEDTLGATSVTLGPDQYFVLGDNRSASFDSRRFGPVSNDEIIGRAWFRGWPINRITKFSKPTYHNL